MIEPFEKYCDKEEGKVKFLHNSIITFFDMFGNLLDHFCMLTCQFIFIKVIDIFVSLKSLNQVTQCLRFFSFLVMIFLSLFFSVFLVKVSEYTAFVDID